MSDQPLTGSAPGIQVAPPVRYATFTSRFRALVIDNCCIAALLLALFFLDDAVGDVPGATRLTWLLMVAVLLLYDPVLVSRRGATIGHAATGLQVVDASTGRWPSFARAFVRSLVKLVLGLLSFFTMELTRRHQAVHDMVTHTTVQVAQSEDLVEFRAERLEEPDVVLPSRFRRLAVIVLYQVVVYFVCSLSLLLLDTTNCFRERSSCSTGMWALLHVFAWAWLALSVSVIIAGWKGLLPGARRSRRVSVDVAVA